jgi:hypothetical protein
MISSLMNLNTTINKPAWESDFAVSGIRNDSDIYAYAIGLTGRE